MRETNVNAKTQTTNTEKLHKLNKTTINKKALENLSTELGN